MNFRKVSITRIIRLRRSFLLKCTSWKIFPLDQRSQFYSFSWHPNKKSKYGTSIDFVPRWREKPVKFPTIKKRRKRQQETRFHLSLRSCTHSPHSCDSQKPQYFNIQHRTKTNLDLQNRPRSFFLEIRAFPPIPRSKNVIFLLIFNGFCIWSSINEKLSCVVRFSSLKLIGEFRKIVGFCKILIFF